MALVFRKSCGRRSEASVPLLSHTCSKVAKIRTKKKKPQPAGPWQVPPYYLFLKARQSRRFPRGRLPLGHKSPAHVRRRDSSDKPEPRFRPGRTETRSSQGRTQRAPAIATRRETVKKRGAAVPLVKWSFESPADRIGIPSTLAKALPKGKRTSLSARVPQSPLAPSQEIGTCSHRLLRSPRQ